MSEHVWKIGDWAVDNVRSVNEVVLVVNTWNDGTVTVCDGTTSGCYVIQAEHLQTAEGCTGYDWQPPVKLQLREGAWYERKDGEIVGPVMPLEPTIGPFCFFYKYGSSCVCNVDIHGKHYPHMEHGIDLIREVPAPTPKYRPFANAEEFKPYRERWVKNKDSNQLKRVDSHSDNIVWDSTSTHGRTFQEAFDYLEFEDGTPFGVRIE